jgi:hypothetical protein
MKACLTMCHRSPDWDHVPAIVVVMIALLLLASCRFRPSYDSARGTLDAEIEMLPIPPGSQVLARHDGISSGQIEECAGVFTELLLGNDLSTADVHQFYSEKLTTSEWEVRLGNKDAIVLHKGDRYTVEISNNYYTSTVARHDKIKIWESQFQSLTYIVIGYAMRDPAECQAALDSIGK